MRYRAGGFSCVAGMFFGMGVYFANTGIDFRISWPSWAIRSILSDMGARHRLGIERQTRVDHSKNARRCQREDCSMLSTPSDAHDGGLFSQLKPTYDLTVAVSGSTVAKGGRDLLACCWPGC